MALRLFWSYRPLAQADHVLDTCRCVDMELPRVETSLDFGADYRIPASMFLRGAEIYLPSVTRLTVPVYPQKTPSLSLLALEGDGRCIWLYPQLKSLMSILSGEHDIGMEMVRELAERRWTDDVSERRSPPARPEELALPGLKSGEGILPSLKALIWRSSPRPRSG